MEMGLKATLNNFASNVNQNAQVQRLTKNWTVDINLQCTDQDEQFLIVVNQGQVIEIKELNDCTEQERKETILLRTHTDCFMDIFEGRCNPAIASLEGDLQVFGDEQHSIKLDAIALILWGFH